MLDRFETFAITIASMNRCIHKIKNQEMQALGLKGIHGMCLYILGKAPSGLTSTQLCKQVKEDKAAVSRAVSELMEKGYVYSDLEEDKRAYRAKILLTDQGKEALDYINIRVNRALDIIGEGLEPDQRKIFYDTLALIAQNLMAYVKSGD